MKVVALMRTSRQTLAPRLHIRRIAKDPMERMACQAAGEKDRSHRMGLILLIVLILLLIGAFPTGGYGLGYGSHGIIGTILIIVLVLYLLGHLR